MPTRFSRLLATLIVAAAMARRGRGRRREPRAKPRRRRREPTPFALIVAGQIRMLRDPRLLENWRTSILEPLRPAVFMSVNTQWTAAAWVQMQADRHGPNTSAADVDRIRRALSPTYCAVANGTSPQWSWFWSWLDAYRGMAGHEISRGSRFKVVLHARPDLFFDEIFSKGWFDGLLKTRVPFAMIKWDFFGMYSRDLAEVRLRMIEASDYPVPSYCGATDQCNIQFFKAHQPPGAVIIDWPWGKPGYGTTIQRNCQTAPSDKWKVPLAGVCINRTSISRERRRFNVERAFAGRCTSTYACKKFVENGACGEAADAVLAQCKCRRTLTTKFGEVCVERCCARRRKKGRKGGTHPLSWIHRKKHPLRPTIFPNS